MTRMGSAIVGAAGLVGAAEAGIVHTVPDAPITAAALAPNGQAAAPLDIDNDGVPEFTIHAFHAETFPGHSLGTYIRADRPGAFFQWEGVLDPLLAGAPIGFGGSDEYQASGQVPFYVWYGMAGGDGAWNFNDAPAFFGLRFETGGASHFGWARGQITYSSSAQTYAVTVFDYAYETTPGAGIAAGAVPAPGGAVLCTLAALPTFRRRRP